MEILGVIIPLAIFGAYLLFAYRRAASSPDVSRERTIRFGQAAVFAFVMAAILLVLVTAFGSGVWFVGWVVVLIAGTLWLRR